MHISLKDTIQLHHFIVKRWRRAFSSILRYFLFEAENMVSCIFLMVLNVIWTKYDLCGLPHFFFERYSVKKSAEKCIKIRPPRPTWSLTPHSPAGAFAPKDFASPLLTLSTCRQTVTSAGLTSKPHHAHRNFPGLRGSFRLRLASTCNHGHAETARSLYLIFRLASSDTDLNSS